MPICCRLVVDKRKWGEIPVKVGSLISMHQNFHKTLHIMRIRKLKKFLVKTLVQKNRICCVAANFFEVHLGDEIMSNYREIASVKNSQICAMPICCRLLVVDKRKNSAKGMNLTGNL